MKRHFSYTYTSIRLRNSWRKLEASKIKRKGRNGMEFNLNRDGFITKYLYSGRRETEIVEEVQSDTNQLRYEKNLRRKIAKHEDIELPKEIHLGENSALGMPWKYYYSHGNIFMDVSSFYVELRRIDLLAAAWLRAEEDVEVKAYLWSCDAVDLWVNEELAGSIDKPVYKPITRKEVTLRLKKGVNRIFVRLETLGVRDTRISFALQIAEQREKIKVVLPDDESVKTYCAAEEILDSALISEGKLFLNQILPEGSSIRYHTETIDFKNIKEASVKEDISGCKEIQLKDYPAFHIEINFLDGGRLKRSFERGELRKPVYLQVEGEELEDTIYEKIGEISSIIREETDGFALYPMLARYHLGQRAKEDEREFAITLSQIERRMDCADFMVCALIRFLKNYSISEEMLAEVKRVMLGFRYWMDEEGQDGMCFWSENHSLMFYQAAYFFGQLYPDESFIRSGKTGREMYEKGKKLIAEWLTDACESGFDEFNSGVYTPITFAAILNLIDYAEADLAEMAIIAADKMINSFAVHCFKGVIISPQGRVYRNVLYPHQQALQSMVHYKDSSAPYVYNEWLSAMATSRYQFPENFKELMEMEGAMTYHSSNACIDIYKTQDYILTSVQSPRRDGRTRTWKADMSEENRNTYLYTKSLNECFHGTMQFEPGVLGYQQHLWYGALDTDLVVFVNHPGGSCEDMPEVRPGYWYGNGITPALRQEKNMLGIVYSIPDTFPITFTHLYWESKKFDRTFSRGNWLFGCKGESYIGVWCSERLEDYDEMLFGCEKRAYGADTAWLCICGSRTEYADFEAFAGSCMESMVNFDKSEKLLFWKEFSLQYEACVNPTQYLE